MSAFSDDVEETPKSPLSEVCVNLENKFFNLEDVNKGEGMQVYARIRPLLDSEKEAGFKECIGILDEQVIRAVVPSSSAKYKMSSHLTQDIIEDFTFTYAYGSETGQFVFFEECMMDTMQNFIENQNSLVFSYGTTGSGKTYTLQGNTDNPGIIPLSLHLFFASIEDQLFDRIFIKPDKFADVILLNDNEIKRELEVKEQILSASNQEEWSFRNSSSSKTFAMLLCDTFSEKFESEGRQTTLGPEDMAQAQAAALMKEISKKSASKQSGYCSVWVSFAEIYNESIYDLLQPNVNQRPKLNLGEDKNGDVYIKGLREVCVFNSYEALKVLNFGQKNLKIASTKLNYQSSRSHCIFTIKVVRVPDPDSMAYAKVNRLSFCDLAGSERAAKSQTTGLRLKEAGCINTSLLVLGRCIEQLRLKPTLRDKKLIPFRESKLTRLFSGFFTGRGKVVMFTNISPSELTFDETSHVLKFAALAKELIIKDNYIATATNTLQSITNMWTNARTNGKDVSSASDKSISFEDSVDEVYQEKDELIEKLLDLAESLKNNLEREKKEKTELEIKIRQDVCQEYSEYSDELLKAQKENFEDDREAIKQIYEKRIASMQQMYDRIIEDYKLQLEESSVDEMSSSAAETIDSKDIEMQSGNGQSSKDENVDTTASICESNNTADKTVELKAGRNLKEIDDYSLCLETEIESLTKKLEDTQLMLQNTMKDNENMKKELDSYKINCFAYKIEVDDLAKKRTGIEHDMKALAEDLTAVSEEKEAIFQELSSYKENLACCNDQVQNLLKRIDELTKVQEKSTLEHTESLEEANTKTSNINTKLSATLCELENEREKRVNAENLAKTMELEISKLQNIEESSILIKETVEALTKEIEGLKEENIILKNKFETTEHSEGSDSLSALKDEMQKQKAAHMDEMEKLSNIIKQHELETTSLNSKLSATFCDLENEREKRINAENLAKTVELEISKLQNIEKSSILREETVEALAKEIEGIKEENIMLKNQFKTTDHTEESDSLSALKDEMQKQKAAYMDEMEKLANTIKQHELETSSINSKLSATVCELENEREQRANAENLAKRIELEISKLQNIEKSSILMKETVDALTKEIEILKEENIMLKNKFETTERTEGSDSLSALKDEMQKQKSAHMDEMEKLSDTIKHHELEGLKEENIMLKNKFETTEHTEESDSLSALKDQMEKQETAHMDEVKKMSDTINQHQLEKMEAEEILKSVNNTLEKALFENEAQKTKLDSLESVCSSLKNELSQLLSIKEDLEKKLDSTELNQDSELEKALEKAKEQIVNLDSLKTENQVCKDKIVELQMANLDLDKKLSATNEELGSILNLVQLLENCEMKATHKSNKMQSDLKQLKENLELSSADHKQERATLRELIEILEKCEAFSSSRIKQFHSSAIDHVEQIMDLKKCLEANDKAIEDLKNDKNALYKELKYLQTTSKKQLQIEKQQFMSEISDLKDKLSASEKLNESMVCKQSEMQHFMSEIIDLKNKLSASEKINESVTCKQSELKAEIDKLEIENENLKLEVEKRNKKENIPEVRTPETKSLESLKRASISEERVLAIRIPKLIVKENTFEENTPQEPTPKRNSSKAIKKRDTLDRKTPEKKTSKKTKKQGDKQKTKQTEKSEATEDKKQNTEIYEEPDANTSKVTLKKESRAGRRHFRCVENVIEQLDLVQKEDKSSSKSQSLKRKKEQYQSEDKSFEKKFLKKLKLFESHDTENITKPQNMRIRLLKGAVAENNIAMPSPRMTRGRKRLIQSKENINQTASPRTVRS